MAVDPEAKGKPDDDDMEDDEGAKEEEMADVLATEFGTAEETLTLEEEAGAAELEEPDTAVGDATAPPKNGVGTTVEFGLGGGMPPGYES